MPEGRGMEKGRLAKILGLAVLLLAASFGFGWACRIAEREYQAALTPSVRTLYPVLWLILASLALLAVAGLVAILVRPLWASLLVFMLSSLTMLFGWRLAPASAIAVGLYLLLSPFYAWRVAAELEERIRFSIRAVSEGQSLLIIALAVAASASIYLGAGTYIEREGFSLPIAKEAVLKIIEPQLKAQFAAQPGMPAEQREKALADFRRQLEEGWAGIEGKVRAFGRFIPPLLALSLFQLLVVVVRLLDWAPKLVLRVLLFFLRSVGLVKVVKEMQEVERLSLD